MVVYVIDFGIAIISQALISSWNFAAADNMKRQGIVAVGEGSIVWPNNGKPTANPIRSIQKWGIKLPLKHMTFNDLQWSPMISLCLGQVHQHSWLREISTRQSNKSRSNSFAYTPYRCGNWPPLPFPWLWNFQTTPRLPGLQGWDPLLSWRARQLQLLLFVCLKVWTAQDCKSAAAAGSPDWRLSASFETR